MLTKIETGKVYKVGSKRTAQTVLKVLREYPEKVLQGCVEIEIISSTNSDLKLGWVGGMDKDYLMKHGVEVS